MDLIQYKGPFLRSQVITVPADPDYKYVHIGIQVPKTQPIAIPVTEVSENGKETTIIENEWRPFREDPIVQINGMDYQLNSNDILEFDGISEVTWRIVFKKNLPAESIIDIVRKT